jgi:hypothetical protein
MGAMDNLTKSKAGPTKPPMGREDLQFWHRELAGALQEESEGVALVQ